jgi:hypothetical protein
MPLTVFPRGTAQCVSFLTVFRLGWCYALLSFMAERKKRPEIDIPTLPKALIGLEPGQTQPEPTAERALDIPTIVRAFQTDAYPLPEGAPLRIAVSDEASLTIYPKQEAIEYRQQTAEHVIYLRASKRGEVAFSVTPMPPRKGE